ncbi:MAG: creatininase family protein [Muribaculaceae bacterium]|nr:creatininase family protein [Muribaculaceae bacterium]
MNKTTDIARACYADTRGTDYALAVLPWGATEPHNLHLPYLTDAILSHDVAVDAAEIALERYGLNVGVLPPVALGAQNPGQRELKFCLHFRQSTQEAVLTDIAHSLYSQGLRTLVIINGHGGNSFKGAVRDLAVELPDMTIAVSDWFKVCPARDFFDRPGDHADELETSVMMHYHPELVDLSRAGAGNSRSFRHASLRDGVAWIPRNWAKVSRDTGIGDPSVSTAEKGARFARAVAERYAELFRDLASGEDLYEE